MYILGYIPGDNRLYLSDKELHVISFQLLLSVLEYQTAVMRRDFDTADKVLLGYFCLITANRGPYNIWNIGEHIKPASVI